MDFLENRCYTSVHWAQCSFKWLLQKLHISSYLKSFLPSSNKLSVTSMRFKPLYEKLHHFNVSMWTMAAFWAGFIMLILPEVFCHKTFKCITRGSNLFTPASAVTENDQLLSWLAPFRSNLHNIRRTPPVFTQERQHTMTSLTPAHQTELPVFMCVYFG